jgi:hypothetical protein
MLLVDVERLICIGFLQRKFMFIEDMHGKSIGNPHPIYIYIYIYIYITWAF